MPKKRSKKYHPKILNVPPYLGKVGRALQSWEAAFRVDKVYLIRLFNNTASFDDLLFLLKILQISWILSERMEHTNELRMIIKAGIDNIIIYTDNKQKFLESDISISNIIVDSINTAKKIITNSGELERLKATQAVLFEGVSPCIG